MTTSFSHFNDTQIMPVDILIAGASNILYGRLESAPGVPLTVAQTESIELYIVDALKGETLLEPTEIVVEDTIYDAEQSWSRVPPYDQDANGWLNFRHFLDPDHTADLGGREVILGFKISKTVQGPWFLLARAIIIPNYYPAVSP